MKVTVLTGGTSSERDVALASAVQVIAALRKCGHAVAVVDTARGYIPESDEARELAGAVGAAPPSLEKLRSLERGLLVSGLGDLQVVRSAEVIFLALHGGTGEDGTLQALLEIIGDCEPCGQMDDLRPGLREAIRGHRGKLSVSTPHQWFAAARLPEPNLPRSLAMTCP